MELKVTELQIPGKISFNFEELKQQLQTSLSDYASMVYTEDQIASAKKDRADLNRLKKALNDERIRQEKEFMKPFDEFKAQVKELCTIIDKASATVDAQVKAFEEQKKQEKLDAITEYWNGTNHPAEIHLSQIMDPKWLNASTSMKTIQEAIDAKVNQILSDLAVILTLPAYSLEANAMYLQTLDLGRAVFHSQRLTELAEQHKARKAEIDAQKPQETTEQQIEVMDAQTPSTEENASERQWIGFQALLSVDEAKALGAYLKSKGIRYKAI